ncbi:hypothetical protein J6590_052104 [Homalodisca vitripennis]|nr:hypothetical protein J6590_052104 [Homalodisca vitripennis]
MVRSRSCRKDNSRWRYSDAANIWLYLPRCRILDIDEKVLGLVMIVWKPRLSTGSPIMTSSAFSSYRNAEMFLTSLQESTVYPEIIQVTEVKKQIGDGKFKAEPVQKRAYRALKEILVKTL